MEICPQGSYYNNTNVRTEADIDLRARHPALFVEYAPNVLPHVANAVLGIGDYGLTYQQIFSEMRTQLVGDLQARFGLTNVEVGKKAIKVKGITGSRAEVDVVPTIQYRYVMWSQQLERFCETTGVCILGTTGGFTFNFPDQHYANGCAKRERTARRFKKIVRIFKRLRADMAEHGLFNVAVPSYLVECLVYLAEDVHFLLEEDAYERVRRIALRLRAILADPIKAGELNEINELKRLFQPGQAWTYSTAVTFIDAVVAHLGDA